MPIAIIVLPVGDKPKLKIAADLREAKPIYDKYKLRTILGTIHVVDLEKNRIIHPEMELQDCPFTFSHTRHWCGNDTCRDS